jgi:L-2-hydroxyglutarate oxidase LhgO
MDSTDCIVVGAGVIGLAIARALALRGREVVIIEAASAFGSETSSRNNEVIHAGFLSPPETLKARLCRAGRDALYRYCAERGIPHRRIGKLMIATDDAETAMLGQLADFAGACGIDDVVALDPAAAQRLEPALRCRAALHSPSTGIVDAHALMLSLLGDAEANGATLVLKTRATRLARRTDGFVVATQSADGDFELGCRTLVNAAGLGARRLAADLPGAPPPEIRYGKGSFFSLTRPAPFQRVVVPLATTLAMGGAFTLDLAGRGKFGPDLEWVDAVDYRVDAARISTVVTAIRRYYPDLPDDVLQPDYAGVRPRLAGPGGLIPDWHVAGPADHGIPHCVQLLGMDSPGLTSCLAIADHVAALLQ